jgi:hypothetical protein
MRLLLLLLWLPLLLPATRRAAPLALVAASRRRGCASITLLQMVGVVAPLAVWGAMAAAVLLPLSLLLLVLVPLVLLVNMLLLLLQLCKLRTSRLTTAFAALGIRCSSCRRRCYCCYGRLLRWPGHITPLGLGPICALTRLIAGCCCSKLATCRSTFTTIAPNHIFFVCTTIT